MKASSEAECHTSHKLFQSPCCSDVKRALLFPGIRDLTFCSNFFLLIPPIKEYCVFLLRVANILSRFQCSMAKILKAQIIFAYERLKTKFIKK